jgi:hypothetical protein
MDRAYALIVSGECASLDSHEEVAASVEFALK